MVDIVTEGKIVKQKKTLVTVMTTGCQKKEEINMKTEATYDKCKYNSIVTTTSKVNI